MTATMAAPAPAGRVPTPAELTAWAAQMQSTARLVAGVEPQVPQAIVDALFVAQRKVIEPEPEGEGKDGDRSFRYVSADQIVGVARTALHAAGLLVTLGGIRFEDVRAPIGLCLVRDVVLHLRARKTRPGCSHTFRDGIRFPIDLRRMTADKATAAAMTSSLAYFLRDLCQIQRLMAGDEIEKRQDAPPSAPATAPPAEDANGEVARVSLLEQKRRREETERQRAPRPARTPKREVRAAVALAGAQLGNPKPTVELGDEDREREAREDAKGREVDTLAAQDEQQADPAWLADESNGPTSTGNPPRSVGSVHAAGALPAAPSRAEGPSGGPGDPSAAEAAPPLTPDTALPVGRGGCERSGGAEGPNPSESPPLAPASGAIAPDACWTCDKAPCVCDARAAEA